MANQVVIAPETEGMSLSPELNNQYTPDRLFFRSYPSLLLGKPSPSPTVPMRRTTDRGLSEFQEIEPGNIEVLPAGRHHWSIAFTEQSTHEQDTHGVTNAAHIAC